MRQEGLLQYCHPVVSPPRSRRTPNSHLRSVPLLALHRLHTQANLPIPGSRRILGSRRTPLGLPLVSRHRMSEVARCRTTGRTLTLASQVLRRKEGT